MLKEEEEVVATSSGSAPGLGGGSGGTPSSKGNPEHFDGANGTKRDGLGARADAMVGAPLPPSSGTSVSAPNE
eukprot:CAMPEP_0194581458 /NCGR_PEP_ID=MMETSP0292-20121207/14912_1 /TAXON_ID=39354 /ORGANISM="Heterosigma akashiwo, Strain CCMP2393" /LENGTH=72 /DNA_ID=CAMNT_0039435205 /DNA_START=579 /DNA_END=797 /DNA_ORIENTATION=+